MTLSDSLYPSTIKANYANITVLVLSKPMVKVNSAPPYFSTPLDSIITIILGRTYELIFPTIIDPDGDLYTVNIVGLNSISSFAEYKIGSVIKMKPTTSD